MRKSYRILASRRKMVTKVESTIGFRANDIPNRSIFIEFMALDVRQPKDEFAGDRGPEPISDLLKFAFLHRPAIDRAIERELPSMPDTIRTPFNEAIHRAIFPGGKRIRPVLALLGAEIFGGSIENAMTMAVASEFIHTSSLVFDDLPSMDDSEERRGDLSLHKRYGEGLATLVAISYLNASYRIANHSLEGTEAAKAIEEMCKCIGPEGMIGGQSLDLALLKHPENFIGAAPHIRHSRNLKTTALIRLSLKLGAITVQASDEGLHNLDELADMLGEAYQLSDDLLDLQDDSKRSDLTNLVSEFQELTLKRSLAESISAAKSILFTNFPDSNARLCLIQLVDYIATRRSP